MGFKEYKKKMVRRELSGEEALVITGYVGFD
jgi:hypothetical protein